MQKLKLEFMREKKRVVMPGSWIPLMLSLLIFSAKFSLGMLAGMMPHLNGSLLFLALELFSSLILGVFAGRAVACLMRFRAHIASA